VVILDVLHYIDARAQEEVLQRVRAALPLGGLLLLRVGDPSAERAFASLPTPTSWRCFCRGHGLVTTHCRNIEEWRALLRECGFESHAVPMSRGTPFANVLLTGTRALTPRSSGAYQRVFFQVAQSRPPIVSRPSPSMPIKMYSTRIASNDARSGRHNIGFLNSAARVGIRCHRLIQDFPSEKTRHGNAAIQWSIHCIGFERELLKAT